ncbi:MAG TPA: ribosome maturation factor RimM [Candidatus Dormibacteraeota bacterium]|nr:ribosome maturation factor RimM [Candidatus Dormibacteraeota bacterium]
MGLVRGVHALRGRLRVEVLTDRPKDRFRRGAVLYAEGSEEPLTVAEARPVADGPGWWLRFRELRDRAAAEGLRDRYLEADVPGDSLAAGEVWWHEVVGTPVEDLEGRPVGVVADLYRAGGAEVLVVNGGPLGELDVPNVASIVPTFAPREGRIVVDLAVLDPEPVVAKRPRGRRTTREAPMRAAPGHGGEAPAPSDREAAEGGEPS